MVQLQKRKRVDVIEFMGFDAFYDIDLLRALLLLFKGLLLDKTLPKRVLSRDIEYLKKSSLKGFEDEMIKEEGDALEYLETMLHANDSYAVRMKRAYQETGNIMESISNRYNYN